MWNKKYTSENNANYVYIMYGILHVCMVCTLFTSHVHLHFFYVMRSFPWWVYHEALLLDRGTNLLSHLVMDMCTLLRIEKLNTTSYHPECNSVVERFNCTLNAKCMLRKWAIPSMGHSGTATYLLYYGYIEKCNMAPWVRNHPSCCFLGLQVTPGRISTSCGWEYLLHHLWALLWRTLAYSIYHQRGRLPYRVLKKPSGGTCIWPEGWCPHVQNWRVGIGSVPEWRVRETLQSLMTLAQTWHRPNWITSCNNEDVTFNMVEVHWWYFCHLATRLRTFQNVLESNKWIPSLNQAYSYCTCKWSSKSVSILDTKIMVDAKVRLTTDLYTKPTDTHQYLDRDSFHPGHSKKSIAYSQVLRIRPISFRTEDFVQRTQEVKSFLIN